MPVPDAARSPNGRNRRFQDSYKQCFHKTALRQILVKSSAEGPLSSSKAEHPFLVAERFLGYSNALCCPLAKPRAAFWCHVTLI